MLGMARRGTLGIRSGVTRRGSNKVGTSWTADLLAFSRAAAGVSLFRLQRPATREGSGPLRLRLPEAEGQMAPVRANNLANMPMSSSGDSGTVWFCVEAGRALQARPGSTEDRGVDGSIPPLATTSHPI